MNAQLVNWLCVSQSAQRPFPLILRMDCSASASVWLLRRDWKAKKKKNFIYSVGNELKHIIWSFWDVFMFNSLAVCGHNQHLNTSPHTRTPPRCPSGIKPHLNSHLLEHTHRCELLLFWAMSWKWRNNAANKWNGFAATGQQKAESLRRKHSGRRWRWSCGLQV